MCFDVVVDTCSSERRQFEWPHPSLGVNWCDLGHDLGHDRLARDQSVDTRLVSRRPCRTSVNSRTASSHLIAATAVCATHLQSACPHEVSCSCCFGCHREWPATHGPWCPDGGGFCPCRRIRSGSCHLPRHQRRLWTRQFRRCGRRTRSARRRARGVQGGSRRLRQLVW